MRLCNSVQIPVCISTFLVSLFYHCGLAYSKYSSAGWGCPAPTDYSGHPLCQRVVSVIFISFNFVFTPVEQRARSEQNSCMLPGLIMLYTTARCCRNSFISAFPLLAFQQLCPQPELPASLVSHVEELPELRFGSSIPDRSLLSGLEPSCWAASL